MGASLSAVVQREFRRRYLANESTGSIADEFGVSRSCVRRTLIRLGVELRSKTDAQRLSDSSGPRDRRAQGDTLRRYRLDEETFRRPLTVESAWALGVIMGDGCVTRANGLLRGLDVVGDRDVCEKVAAILGSNHPLRDHGNYASVRFHSPRIAESLIALGVEPKKSRTMTWPELPSALVPHFFRGFFDADGCVTGRRRTPSAPMLPVLSLCSASERFMQGAAATARSVTGSEAKLLLRGGGDYFLMLSCQKAFRLGHLDVRGLDRSDALFSETCAVRRAGGSLRRISSRASGFSDTFGKCRARLSPTYFRRTPSG